ncbi:MAG: 3-hydroxyacyl-CoA dehydrogenase NAD-binding domain-containing protein [Mobilitalea sp.]
MKEIKNVLICGGGMMGKGIAHILSVREDLKITVYDMYDSPFNEGLKDTFLQLVDKNILSEEEVEKRVSRVNFTTDLESSEIKAADLVIECVFEKLDIKQDMFAKLEERCSIDTIFCTNTSVISPTEISEKLVHKERLVGTHFWNPAFLIPLVEVVKSKYTQDEVADTVMEFLRKVEKKPVLCQKDVPGFIANRMQHALWREAIYIVEQGIADAATVDEAVRNSFGLRLPQLGPLENVDMVGTDLTYNIHSYIFKDLCRDTEPSALLCEKLSKGDIGFKTGHGFQEWTPEQIEKSKKDLNEYLIRMLYHV